MQLEEWLKHATARLAQFDSPKLEAQLLAAHILRVDRSFLLAHPEDDFPDLAGEALLQRRENDEPLAYILGAREFYGRPFRVTPAVLIPRQETEVLVEAALAAENVQTVLDIGTGSGCIAITLKLERPAWGVKAVDISPEALEIARENAESLGAEVDFFQSDLFENVLGESFDLIVSNPPYVGVEEELSREVRDFEPSRALFAADHGLSIYRQIAEKAADHLDDGGALLIEVGYQHADVVTSLLQDKGWQVESPILDLSGIPRVIRASKAWECKL